MLYVSVVVGAGLAVGYGFGFYVERMRYVSGGWSGPSCSWSWWASWP